MDREDCSYPYTDYRKFPNPDGLGFDDTTALNAWIKNHRLRGYYKAPKPKDLVEEQSVLVDPKGYRWVFKSYKKGTVKEQGSIVVRKFGTENELQKVPISHLKRGWKYKLPQYLPIGYILPDPLEDGPEF